ncbi:NGG1p interacting factor NIF3 [Pseudomonas sp. Marseille-QA0892]
MYKLCFFVPESHLEPVKSAVFAAGGGRIGDYEACSWQTLGEGQFRPGPGADPYLGTRGQLEKVTEWKVEMVVADQHIQAAVTAMKKTHPYETPAYQVWALLDI